jgi:hypothetical protein
MMDEYDFAVSLGYFDGPEDIEEDMDPFDFYDWDQAQRRAGR